MVKFVRINQQDTSAENYDFGPYLTRTYKKDHIRVPIFCYARKTIKELRRAIHEDIKEIKRLSLNKKVTVFIFNETKSYEDGCIQYLGILGE